jgi:surface antigen
MLKTALCGAALSVLLLGSAAAQEDYGDGTMPTIREANSIGIEAMLDAKDLELMRAARQHVLESYDDGQTLTWFNPDSSHAGRVEARPGNNANADTRCRTINEQVMIGGVIYEAADFYCRLAYDYWINRKSYTRQFAGRFGVTADGHN